MRLFNSGLTDNGSEPAAIRRLMQVAILSLAGMAASAASAVADERTGNELNLQERIERYSFEPSDRYRELQEQAEPSTKVKKRPASTREGHKKQPANSGRE